METLARKNLAFTGVAAGLAVASSLVIAYHSYVFGRDTQTPLILLFLLEPPRNTFSKLKHFFILLFSRNQV